MSSSFRTSFLPVQQTNNPNTYIQDIVWNQSFCKYSLLLSDDFMFGTVPLVITSCMQQYNRCRSKIIATLVMIISFAEDSSLRIIIEQSIIYPRSTSFFIIEVLRNMCTEKQTDKTRVIELLRNVITIYDCYLLVK